MNQVVWSSVKVRQDIIPISRRALKLISVREGVREHGGIVIELQLGDTMPNAASDKNSIVDESLKTENAIELVT